MGLYAYMGAKSNEADKLVEMFLRRDKEGRRIERFVDTNFGAGNVVSAAAGFYKERISNDFDSEIVLLANVVANKSEREIVLEKLFNMEASRETFEQCLIDAENQKLNRIDRAAAIWYTFLLSWKGDRENFWDKDFKYILLNKMDSFCTYEGVQIKNMDMIDLLKEEKSYPELLNHTFYYLDPPYLNNKVRYKKNSETLEFHEELTKVIDGIPYIMISGYDNEIYERNLVEKLHFHKYVFAEKVENIENVKAGGMRPERIEVIWTSYEL